jgi:hypothetical protein
MRRRSTWFFGLLLAASLLEGCAGSFQLPADSLSVADAYRLALSTLTMAGE